MQKLCQPQGFPGIGITYVPSRIYAPESVSLAKLPDRLDKLLIGFVRGLGKIPLAVFDEYPARGLCPCSVIWRVLARVQLRESVLARTLPTIPTIAVGVHVKARFRPFHLLLPSWC